MAVTSVVPMRTSAQKPSDPRVPAPSSVRPVASRHSKRTSKQFVPFSGVDFKAKPEKKTKKGKKKEPKGKKATKAIVVRKVGKGVDKKKKGKKEVKKIKEKKVSKKGNDRLVPRPAIKFGRDHAAFGVTDYVSNRTLSRQLFAAVEKGDIKQIEKIYKDNRISKDVACQRYSAMDDRSPISVALQSANEKVITALIKCHQSLATRKDDAVVVEPNLLQRRSTGRANFHMLGRATRAIESARGGREGNNAFLNYEGGEDSMDDSILSRLDFVNVSYPSISVFSLAKKKGGNDPIITEYQLQMKFLDALRHGNRELAHDLAQLQSHNFNNLQLESLKVNGKMPKPILAVSARKKSFIFRNITPVHTAAIHPDPTFLAAIRDVDPVINIPDQNNWYTMHYAAVCEGDGPLKFLISKDVGVCDVNKQGEMPLHVAARAGRIGNVKVLLDVIAKMEKSEKSNDEEEEEEEDDGPPKAKRAKRAAQATGKKSIVNAKTRKGRTALHYAIWAGRYEVVRILLANPAVDKECPNSANDKKLTPLMLAVGRGHIDIAEMLIEKGCLVEGRDKMKRSPLMIAAINGQTNLAAMLLQKGADVNRKDSSGNTAMHYACAYGWMEIVKLIAGEDVETLRASNEWLLTPLSIAYLKGHYGIVSWLLDKHSAEVDVNCKDNEGVTLISSLLSYHDHSSTAHLPDQINYLITRGANCSMTDTNGNSPLHMFAAVPIILKVDKPAREAPKNDERITSAQYKKCIDQLISAKADPLAKNTEGATPLAVALSAGNLYLASLLLDMCGKELLKDEGQSPGKANILHTLVTVPHGLLSNRELWAYKDAPIGGQYNIVPMLKKIASMVGAAQIETLLSQPNEDGYTPVLKQCFNISTMSNVGSMDSAQFGAFAATVMAGLRECLRMRPDSVLDRRVPKKDQNGSNNADESQNLSVIKLALEPGMSKRGKNILLDALLSCAGENNNLHAFLTQKIMTEEVNCAVTPLIKTLLKKQELESILILRAAKDAGIQEEICGATIESRPVQNGEEPKSVWVPPTASSTVFGSSPFGMKITRSLPASMTITRQSVPMGMARAKASVAFGGRKQPDGAHNSSSAVGETSTEPWNKTAFQIAIHNGLLETIPHFVISIRQAAAVDADGGNAWHYAAQQLSHSTIKLFELLEDKSVPIVPNMLGQTPLHVSVNAETTGSADTFLDPIEWLMERDNIAALDNQGRSALHYAFQKVDEKGKAIELRKQDPIAVVSLLIGKMDKKMIRSQDKLGNTGLHLAARADANICLVSMLAKGAEVDLKNEDGNSPLALALLAKSPAAALTLIQAHADINGPVLGPVPTAKKEKAYRFLADPVVREFQFQSDIPDVVVRNEWHSLVYVILDIMGKTPDTISKLVAAALRNGQHNFAIYLLKLLGKPTPEVQKAMLLHDFLTLYVDSLSGPVEGPAATVLDRILELKVQFIDDRGHSSVVEKACRKGHYQLLERLVAHDSARFSTLKPHPGGSSPLQALIQRWLVSSRTERQTIRYWMQRFCSFPGLDLERSIGIPARALPGCKEALADDGFGNGCDIYPLIAAIRAQDPELIQFLVTECKADLNKASPHIPIVEAVITNNHSVVKALVDGEIETYFSGAAINNISNGTAAKATPISAFSFGVTSNQMRNMTNGAASDEESSDMDDDDDTSDDGQNQNQPAAVADDDEANQGDSVNKQEMPINIKGKNAAIDITIKDNLTGRNLCHYFVEPCGWQNVGLFEALVKVYKGKMTKLITSEDINGETPLSLAAKNNQHRMVSAMTRHATKATGVNLAGLEITVPAATDKDVKGDSDELMNDFATAQMTKANNDKKTLRVPNSKSGYEETGEIVECSDTQQLFKVLLNKTDLRGGLYGFHNYYKMELIKRKDTDLFILFTNWGRIGDSHGEFQCTPFNSLEAGVKEFKSVFKQKTGQEWCVFFTFDEKPGKYRLTMTEDNVKSAADVEIENFKLEKEDEDVPEMKFMADVANVKQLRRYARSVRLSNGTSVSCPFGRVSKISIVKAREILESLRMNHIAMDKAREKRPPSMDQIFKLTDEQYTLTSQFYTMVPIGGYERSKINVISSAHELMTAEGILTTIGDIEIAGRMVSAAAYAKKKRDEDPLRYMLSALDCSISLLPAKEELAQRVLQWIKRSKESCDVQAIYSINVRRAAEAMKAHDNCGNVTYLLHGTKSENLLSILHYGLKATPANALQCGQAYGKGVYFADTFEKSESYCGPSASGLNYMLVCKVAVGYINNKDELEAKDKFDTRKVSGTREPCPYGALTIDGASMPLGPLVERVLGGNNGWWKPPHNEFIVKDETRILPVMIIAFKN